MEKEVFQKRLEDLGELAKINNNRLSTDAVKTFLKDMDLTEEQYNLVFAYLASKLITVEGYVSAAEGGKDSAPTLSEEEQTFLARYEEDLSYLTTLTEEALLKLCRDVEETGDSDAKSHLTEQLLPKVVETAKHYAGRGLPIGDLIQEGNIGLMLALETLGIRGDGVSALDYLKQEIEKAVSEALEDQQTEKSAGELIADRLNELSDGIKELSGELERQVSVEELSAFMDMPVEEIEDLLKLAVREPATGNRPQITPGTSSRHQMNGGGRWPSLFISSESDTAPETILLSSQSGPDDPVLCSPRSSDTRGIPDYPARW